MRAAVGQRCGRVIADSGVGAGDNGDAPGLIGDAGRGPSAMGVHGRQPYSPRRFLRGVMTASAAAPSVVALLGASEGGPAGRPSLDIEGRRGALAQAITGGV